MNYDNIINHLKIWYKDKIEQDNKETKKRLLGTYTGRRVLENFETKLSTLKGKNFESDENFKDIIFKLLYEHYKYYVQNSNNWKEKQFVKKANQELCVFVGEILSKKYVLPLVDIPYNRVIIGDELDKLWDKFLSTWRYGEDFYWYPLTIDKPEGVSEIFFVEYKYFEPYMEQIRRLTGCPNETVYCHSEILYNEMFEQPQYCIETPDFEEYSNFETFFTDKEFMWAIYFSHHNTVTFAGSIVPQVKEIMINEKEHWDEW